MLRKETDDFRGNVVEPIIKLLKKYNFQQMRKKATFSDDSGNLTIIQLNVCETFGEWFARDSNAKFIGDNGELHCLLEMHERMINADLRILNPEFCPDSKLTLLKMDPLQ
jgi:hypothetical protein